MIDRIMSAIVPGALALATTCVALYPVLALGYYAGTHWH